jgi:hypothetical protein
MIMNSTTNSELSLPPQSQSVAWVDRLLGGLFRWFHAPLIRQTGGEVARECHAALWDHAFARAQDMTPAQVRGYIRAIAPGFITREIDAVLGRRRVRWSLRSQVLDAAIDQITELIVDDVVCIQARRAMPARSRVA